MNRVLFLFGLNLLCMSVLIQQIALTRVLSVLVHFHLAFLSISMAMLGLTAGAVWVFVRNITQQQAYSLLPRVCFLYGIGTIVSILFIVSTYLTPTLDISGRAALLKIILLMAVPFSTAGVAISLCLTRGPGKIGLRYAVDLIGAALGCLLCFPLLNTFPGPNVVVISGGLGILAAGVFQIVATRETKKTGSIRTLTVALALAVSGLLSMSYIHVPNLKSPQLIDMGQDFERWNTFSQITATTMQPNVQFYWGKGKNAPTQPHPQRFLTIDGLAGTPLYAFNRDYASADFLRFDITNLAYSIRHSGHSAVIGVGGGRDILAARHFGFEDVTAVELNPIMVDLLTKEQPFADFAGLNHDPHIHFNVDDGRSWFARTTQKFDLLQMSMVDTWAATGAGSFTLSENGLYTMEGWAHFINALAPNGVFTVSRWYAEDNINETGRVIALAMASLINAGVENPRDHIYLVGTDRLATLVLTRAALTSSELDTLDRTANEMGFHILLHPGQPIANPVLNGICSAKTVDEIQSFAKQQVLDVSAPSDAQPFFFNQLKLLKLISLKEALAHNNKGVLSGNINATIALLAVILLSAMAVVFVLLVPAWSSVRHVRQNFARAGTAWFFLIGFGFMLVEIGTIQRMSIFLGHPVYGLAIVLFSLILLTGIGSFLSDFVRLEQSCTKFLLWIGALVTILLLTITSAPPLLAQFEGDDIVHRAALVVGLVAPSALLMGFAFPLGMTLADRIDTTPTPWFWSVNGAAGVLGSGVAVLLSMNTSIPVTLFVGTLCYLALILPGITLYRLAQTLR